MSSSTSTNLIISRVSDSLKTPTGKLAVVALASTVITTASIFGAQALRRTTRRRRLKSSIDQRLESPDDLDEDEVVDFTRPVGSRRGSMAGAAQAAAARSGGGGAGQQPARRGSKKATSEVIIREALARNYAFFGDDKMDAVRDKFVVVVGLGGVGSAAAVMLVRSGIRKIRLIDFDQVSLSSLNRHSTATLAQVGTPKVTSCADYFAEVAPWVEVDARIELFEKDRAAELLEGQPDYVVDCIDNIDSKVDLLAYCCKNGLPVFASLGAACKSDPSRIQVADISTTFEDPLAKSVRRRLRLEGVSQGVPVVVRPSSLLLDPPFLSLALDKLTPRSLAAQYSTEKPRPDLGLLPLDEAEFEKGKVDELHAMQNFRVRILPVLGPLPAMVRPPTLSHSVRTARDRS